MESSGFTVTIFPTDADGQLTPASGTLDVDLIGQRLSGDDTAGDFPSVGHWTMEVSPSDFGPSGAVYRCPFQAVHPDFDYDLRPIGLVHARLTVPGDGVFEASQRLCGFGTTARSAIEISKRPATDFSPLSKQGDNRARRVAIAHHLALTMKTSLAVGKWWAMPTLLALSPPSLDRLSPRLFHPEAVQDQHRADGDQRPA